MTEPNQGSGVIQRLSTVLPIALGTIAFGVPVLYALGRVYSEAYWDQLQLPVSVASHRVDDYIYLGFIAIFNSCARFFSSLGGGTLRYLLAVTVVVVVLAIYGVVLNKLAAPALKRRLQRMGRWVSTWESPHRKWVLDTAKITTGLWLVGTTLLLALAIAFVFVALPLVWVYDAGKFQAKRDRSKLVAVGEVPIRYGARPILHYRDGLGPSKASLLLQCADQWCVAYEGGFFVAVKTDAVERIDHCPRRVQLKNGVAYCADFNEAPPPGSRDTSASP